MSLRKTAIMLSCLSPRKIWNLLRLYFSYHWSRITGRPAHAGMPMKIGIEPTTSCNLRCPECPSGLRSFTRPTGMLSLGHFQSMTDELRKDLIYMLMYFQGEPYLNPEFLPMVRYASKRGIYVATSTNGHYLTPEKAEETVKSGISEVLISVDGVTQESYQSYRIGGQLEKVKTGIRNLVEARKALKSRRPFIILQFLVTGPNEHEVEAVKRLGKELGVDKVALKTAQIYDFENGSPLIPKADKYSRYRKGSDGKYHIKNRMKNQCWKLWQGAEITWDGRVLPCCFDKDAQYEMGQLGRRSFRDIWRSKAYRDFRGNILKGRGEVDICRNCTEGLKVWA